MKRVMVLTVLLAFALIVSVSAQSVSINVPNGPISPSYGAWAGTNGRLYQNDANNPLAKINFQIPQSGTMEYQFNVRYQGGAEDMMGGFGIQVFIDQAFNGKSWGDGNSYLLWLNYDNNPNAYGGSGFRAEVYRSTSPVHMTIDPSLDYSLDPSVLTDNNMSTIVPVKIIVNGDTGNVKVYDPTTSTPYYYEFTLPTAPGSGNYVALRTNSLAVSFGNLVVTKLQ